MRNLLPAILLSIMTLSGILFAGETRIVLPDTSLKAPVSVIYIENRSRHAVVKLPPRPIAQTILGIFFSSEALISAGMGTYYFIEADRARKDTAQDIITSSVEAVFDDILATCFMISAGGSAIPGIILCVAAKKRWDVFNRAQASIGFRYNPYRNSIGAMARIDF